MNYQLTIKAQLDGRLLGECHKAIEIIASINGVVLEESSFKPIDTPTIVVSKRKTKTFTDDPRMVYKTMAKPDGTGGTRAIDIESTLINLKLTREQVQNGNWKSRSIEYRVQQAIKRQK